MVWGREGATLSGDHGVLLTLSAPQMWAAAYRWGMPINMRQARIILIDKRKVREAAALAAVRPPGWPSRWPAGS